MAVGVRVGDGPRGELRPWLHVHVCVCVCTCGFRVEGAGAGERRDAAQPSSAEWAPAMPGCPALLSPRGPRGGAGAPAGRPCSAETTILREK